MYDTSIYQARDQRTKADTWTRSRWASIGAAVAVTVGLGGFVTASASSGSPSSYVPVSPCRLVDTRENVQGTTALGADKSMAVAAHGTNGACVLPSDAQGLALNVTAVQGSALSFMTVYPATKADLSRRPSTGMPEHTRSANHVTVLLSTDGHFNVYNNAGTVHVVIDVVGYYLTSTPGVAPQSVKGDPGVPAEGRQRRQG